MQHCTTFLTDHVGKNGEPDPICLGKLLSKLEGKVFNGSRIEVEAQGRGGNRYVLLNAEGKIDT